MKNEEWRKRIEKEKEKNRFNKIHCVIITTTFCNERVTLWYLNAMDIHKYSMVDLISWKYVSDINIKFNYKVKYELKCILLWK